MRVPTSQNHEGWWCAMSAKHAPGIPERSVDPSGARPRGLCSVGDQASPMSGATEVFAVDWQLADQFRDVS